MVKGSNLIFLYQLMVWPLFTVCTPKILRIFWMGKITAFLAHAVVPRCLVSCINMLPGTGKISHAFNLQEIVPCL